MMLGCERVKEVSFLCEKLLPSECTNEKGVISCCKHWTDNPTCQFGPHVPYLRRKKRRNVPPRYVCHFLLDDVSDNAVCDNVVCVWHVSMLCVWHATMLCVWQWRDNVVWDDVVRDITTCCVWQECVCVTMLCMCDNVLGVTVLCDTTLCVCDKVACTTVLRVANLVCENAVRVWQCCVWQFVCVATLRMWQCCKWQGCVCDMSGVTMWCIEGRGPERMEKEQWIMILLRVIPTLTHYSDIVSDISSASKYGICWHIWYMYIFQTFYLTFFLAYTLPFYLTLFLASSLAFYLASILTFFLASLLTIFLASILQSTWHLLKHSFWQPSWHSIGHFFWHSIWRSIRHLFWHSFWHST